MKLPDKELKAFLNEKVIQYNTSRFIHSDPIQIPARYQNKEDIEIAGFLSATIAWGNRTSIIKNAEKLMKFMEDEPYNYVCFSSYRERERLNNFVHRTFNGEDCQYFIRSLKNIYLQHGGLQNVFEQGYKGGQNVKSALEHFYAIFFELEGERTRKHVSNVQNGASAKRLNMFLRWMVRRDHGNVDFGLWKGIPASALMLPLDVHTGNVGRKLGILTRKSNDWKAVEEITTSLKKLDASDPVKYDFALFGLGVFEKF